MTERKRLTLNAQTTEEKAASCVEERDSSYVKPQVVPAHRLNERRQNRTTKAKENLLVNTAEQWH